MAPLLPARRTRPLSRIVPSWYSPLALLGGVAFVLLALHLLSPALTVTHVEGFTALIQLEAIAAHLGLIDRADLLYPVQTEYFYLTRQGVVLLLRGLMRLSGHTDDGVFRLLTQLSFIVFLGCAGAVARRYGRLGWPAVLGSLLLVPGVFELGFFFSDSVVSLGFGMLGLAVLPPAAASRLTVSWAARGLLAGAALGMATLCRTDSMLLLPLAAGLAWLDQRRWSSLLLLGLLVCAGVAAAFAVSYAMSGTTMLQAVQIGRFFDQLHGGARSRLVRVAAFVLFFGLPGLVLTAIGAAATVRQEGIGRRSLVLLVLPLPVLLLGLRGATEVRQIYPLLTPFVVIQCGVGLQWVWHGLRSGERGRGLASGAVALGIALAWVLPPVFVPVRDGPRALIGRLWSPPMWRAWQARVVASLDDVDALVVAAARVPRLVAVTAHFNSDHYLQLRAWQRGWMPLRPQETAADCVGGVQVWRRDGHALVQVRLENPYAISALPPADFIALQMSQALRCPSVNDGAPAYLSDFVPPLSEDPLSVLLRTQMPALPPPRVSFGWPVAVASRIERWLGQGRVAQWLPPFYGVSHTALLSPGQLAEARDLAAKEMPPAGSPAFDGLFHTRFWHPPASGPEPERR